MKTPTAKNLVGIWYLESVETPTVEGTLYPFGLTPSGTILYLANGSMAVHIAGSDKASDLLRAYGGTWRIAGDRVVHEVEVSAEPHLLGVRLERRAELVGERLIYKTIEAQGPGNPIVVWSRKKRLPFDVK